MEKPNQKLTVSLKTTKVIRASNESELPHPCYILIGLRISLEHSVLIDAVPFSNNPGLLSSLVPEGVFIIGTFSISSKPTKLDSLHGFPVVSITKDDEAQLASHENSTIARVQLTFLKTPEEEKQFFRSIMTFMLSVTVPFGETRHSFLLKFKEATTQKSSTLVRASHNETQKLSFLEAIEWSSVRKEWLKDEGDKPLNERSPIQVTFALRNQQQSGSSMVLVKEIEKQLLFEDLVLVNSSASDSEVVDSFLKRLQNNLNKDAVGDFHLVHQNRFRSFPFLVSYSGKSMKPDPAYSETLEIPVDRPLIRVQDSLSHKNSISKEHSGKLKDVHLELVKKPEIGSESYFVEGSYIYFHYLQDGFKDDGWGCAYRSLQTIISWFLENNYVSGEKVKVPSHIEIQRTLVKLGDKPSSFIGSSEWIGSFEVSMVLQSLCGVESTLLHVERGSLVSSKTSAFIDHFSKQGTPIMIGGGVLAYTMLGISVAEDGTPMYLILDPHYKGADALKNVISKKGVFWKDSSLFRADSFYNFCCPNRPKIF